MLEDAYALGITEIVVGDLKVVRANSHSSKANVTVDDLWSFNYIIRRIREKAEEHGIEVAEVSGHKTSSICPLCRSEMKEIVEVCSTVRSVIRL